MPKLVRFSRSAALRPLPALALASATLCAALFAVPAHAVTFTEIGDAGQTLATAQATGNGNAVLTSIGGVLSSTTDADLFLISITSPASFSASTVAGNLVDTQLFLFTLAGAPVFANDDAAVGQSLGSALPAGSAFGPVTSGQYYLAVSMSGYEPINSSGQTLFTLPVASTDLRGPTSGLQPARLGGWTGGGFDTPAAYAIQLTGAAVAAAVPEPGSVLLMLVGCGVLALTASSRRVRAAAARQA